MDYRRLVAEGTYKKSDLSEKSQAYITGMEKALDSADCFLAGMDFEVENSPVMGKIIEEVYTNCITRFKEYLESDICEAIVVNADIEAEQEERNG